MPKRKSAKPHSQRDPLNVEAVRELEAAKDLADKVIDTVRESMIVLDVDLRVVSANATFYRTFQVDPAETEGKLIYELGNCQWDIPELRRLLEEVLPHNQFFNDYEVDHEFESIGRRVMRLNARRVDHIDRILLAIEDITEFRLAELQREFLLELSDAFYRAVSPQEVLQEAAARIGELLQCDRVGYGEIDATHDRVEILVQYARDLGHVDQRLLLSAFGPLTLEALEQNESLAIGDVAHDSRTAPYLDAYDRIGLRSLACVPRLKQKRLDAFIALGHRGPHPWTDDEISLIHEVASRTWLALDTARAEEELQLSEQRLRMAAEATGFGTYDFDVELRESIWSEELRRLNGYDGDSPVKLETIASIVHPDDRAGFQQLVDEATDPVGPGKHEANYRIVRPDGQVRWVVDTGCTVFEGHGNQRRAVRVIGTIQDVTQRKQAAEQLRKLNESLEDQVTQQTAMLKLLQDITRAANEAKTVDEAMQSAMRRIAQYNGWQVGHLWLMAPDNGQLISSGMWYVSDRAAYAVDQLDAFMQICEQIKFSLGEDLVGAVFESGEPVWIDDIDQFPNWQRGAADEVGLHAAIAFPVTVNGNVVAVVEFFSDHPARREEAFMEVMPDVGIQLGHVIERKRLEKEIADAAEREQSRIGSDMHDGIGQELTGLRFLAQTHADALASGESPEADLAQRIAAGLETVQQQLRAVIRDLVPVELDQEGLVSALRSLAERTTETHRIDCRLVCEQPVAVHDNVLARHVFRIVQEAVNNAVKHADAELIAVRLDEHGNYLRLQIVDDGMGIPPRTERTSGLGLRSMAFRANLIGARLRIEPGQMGGTVVSCVVPKSRGRKREEDQ